MARKHPEGFYVYLHRRKSDGLIFYVGKGSGGRAWHLSDAERKNDYWSKTKKKHGICVEIYRSGMSEPCAFTLEKMLIHHFRIVGMPLTNMTNGGDGVSGLVSSQKIAVHCSNGMSFDSMSEAADWLRDNGWPNANSSRVSAASFGVRGTAYNLSWWRDGHSPKTYVDHYKERGKKRWRRVFCSNGMSFDNSLLAAEWIESEHGCKAYADHIRSACQGKHEIIHGYRWSYEDIFTGNWEYVSRKRAVFCSNGMKFDTVTDAAKWVSESGLGKCHTTLISRACSRPEALAYGLAWWYEGDKEKIPSDPMEVIRRKASRPVERSDGMVFDSAKSASIFMRSEGWPNAVASGISRVVRKRGKSAYGYGWKYANE